MFDGALHPLTTKESFCFESIVHFAREPKVCHCLTASNRVRLDMVELEEVTLPTAPPLLVDESALSAVSFEHSSSNRRGHASPGLGIHRRSALPCAIGLSITGDGDGIRPSLPSRSGSGSGSGSGSRILGFAERWSRFLAWMMLKLDRQFERLRIRRSTSVRRVVANRILERLWIRRWTCTVSAFLLAFEQLIEGTLDQCRQIRRVDAVTQ
jgi:hypothetical protein